MGNRQGDAIHPRTPGAGRQLLCINSLSKSESFCRDPETWPQCRNCPADYLSLGEPGITGMSPDLAEKTQKSPRRAATLGFRRQLLVGKTRFETFSSPNRIRIFAPEVNSRLLTSGAGGSVNARGVDKAP